MTQNANRRLTVCSNHLRVTTVSCVSSPTIPVLTISPETCLVDEKTHITVRGLAADQVVTLTSSVEEGGKRFEAQGVYRSGLDGMVDTRRDPSTDGSFTGVEEMGLFWSLKPSAGHDPYLRLIKKDVTTPHVFTISVYDGAHRDNKDIQARPLTSAIVRRLYKSPGVRSIPVTEGKLRGTIFIPEGEGPFPALVDVYGSLVSLVESRAALLASRGYVTFALCYLYQAHLPKTVTQVKLQYFKDAVEWFSQQEYVDEDRVGVIGLCFGGFLMMTCAAICPKVRVVVNINGMPVIADSNTIHQDGVNYDYMERNWPNPDRAYMEDGGLVVNAVFDYEDAICIPAWRHGAKILTIVGEDDKQTHPKWHTYFDDRCPAQYRRNVEMVRYPGAGHLIEPPYSPLCRATKPGRARLASVEFIKEEYRDCLMLAGGNPKQHALAQEDAWRTILNFLKKNL